MTAEAKLWKSADPLKLVEPIRERQRADRVETKATVIGFWTTGCWMVSKQPLALLTS